MTRILNIETASSLCSASISEDGITIAYTESEKPNSHSTHLASLVNNLFEKNGKDIAAVAVSIGPGSYTGLRIGLSLAKGIAYSMNIPLISVPTLQIIAAGFIEKNNMTEGLICPMMDAGRNEVYIAVYDKKLNAVIDPIPVILDKIDQDRVFNSDKYNITGSGAKKAETVLKGNKFEFTTEAFLSAGSMQKISLKMFTSKEFSDVAYQTPQYLKDFIAIKPKLSLIYKGTQFDKSV